MDRFLTFYPYLDIGLISLIKAFKGLYRLCQCGCGVLIKIVTKNRQIRKFIIGHTGRLNKGQNNGQYKSGRYFHKSSGYWYLTSIFGHPNSDRRGRIPEHIYNFTMFNKCCILPWGVVHHIDENQVNNMPWNLQAMMRPDHIRLHETVDMSGRRCSLCRNDTGKRKHNGRPNWFGNEVDGWKCKKCYLKERWKKLKNLTQVYQTVPHTN